MQDTLTLRGFVATDPATRHTSSGATVVGFRVATTERRFDRTAGVWVDAHTNWYNVSAFGQLGSNTAQSVKKGNPVIITGRLRVRDWSTEEKSGTSVDIVADAVGLDLGWGAGAFVRNQRAGAPRQGEEERPAEDDGPGAAGRDADGFDSPLPRDLAGGDAPSAAPLRGDQDWTGSAAAPVASTEPDDAARDLETAVAGAA